MRAWLVISGAWFCSAAAGAEDAPFRRVLFDISVPLGTEAPGIAVEGNVAAYALGDTIHFLDARTGEPLVSRSVLSDPQAVAVKQAQVRLLGMVDGTVYACVSWHDAPEKPKEKKPGVLVFSVAAGRHPARVEAVAVRRDSPRARSLLDLPTTATMGEGLLGRSLVYTGGQELVVVPLEGGGEERRFDLDDEPVNRASVSRDEVFLPCRNSLCWYRLGDAHITRLPVPHTALSLLDTSSGWGMAAQKAGNVIVAYDHSMTIGCDLAGRPLWRFQAPESIATGPEGPVCVYANEVLHALAPEDGRVLWRRPLRLLSYRSGLEGLSVFEGRVFALGQGYLAVLDASTGRILVDMPSKWKRVRDGSSYCKPEVPVIFRSVPAGDTLIVGFETWVYGLDLTPTAEVPERLRASDPANALGELAQLDSAGEPRQTEQKLIAIGRNMADTPEEGAKVLPVLKERLAKQTGFSREQLLYAFHWLKDPEIQTAMIESIEEGLGRGDVREQMVEAVGCCVDAELARPVLVQVAREWKLRPKVREAAARHLRLLGVRAELSSADLELLYGADHAEAVAEFGRRLREADAEARAQVLELLKLAPDAVVVALSEELTGLPEGEERRLGTELVRQAREGLTAIRAFREVQRDSSQRREDGVTE